MYRVDIKTKKVKFLSHTHTHTPAMDLHIDLSGEPRYLAVFGKVDTIQDQVIGHYGVTEGNVIGGAEELVHKHTTCGNEHT